jgi:hypothetical protein
MALRTPPAWLQAGSYTAENDRLIQQAIFSTSGITPYGLGVNPQATPNMSVYIRSGYGAIVGDSTTTQGVYTFFNDANTNVTIAAADTVNPRIDRIVATVADAAYSGTQNQVVFQSITGTAAASPVAPATPLMSISLATVAVAANATSITAANITQTRVLATSGVPYSPYTYSLANAATGQNITTGQTLFPGMTYGGILLYTNILYEWEIAGSYTVGNSTSKTHGVSVGTSGGSGGKFISGLLSINDSSATNALTTNQVGTAAISSQGLVTTATTVSFSGRGQVRLSATNYLVPSFSVSVAPTSVSILPGTYMTVRPIGGTGADFTSNISIGLWG